MEPTNVSTYQNKVSATLLIHTLLRSAEKRGRDMVALAARVVSRTKCFGSRLAEVNPPTNPCSYPLLSLIQRSFVITNITLLI